MPPLETQRRIADYLDNETARIDTLITKNTHAATLVEERLRAEFAALLVTEGGDLFSRRVADRRAGPPLGLVATTYSGKTVQSEQRSPAEDLVPYLTASNVTDGGIIFDAERRMWATPEEARTLAVRRGDVLVIEGGATAGRAVILDYDPPEQTILQNHVHCVRPLPGWHGPYLGAVLRAYYESGWYAHYTNAVTFGSFPATKLRSLVMPERDWADQVRVADHLNTADTEARRATGLLARQRSLLDERRQALITAAVTGEIEV